MLNLNNGQSVYSRTANYSAPATGAARSTFNGGFILRGNNTLEGVILNNVGVLFAGRTVAIAGTGNGRNLINNSQIGTAIAPYHTGIYLESGSAVIRNTNVFGVIYGIQVNEEALTVNSSQINSQLAGLEASLSQVEVNDSQINVFGINQTFVMGVNSIFESLVTLQNTNVNVRSSPPATSIGLRALFDSQIEMIEGALTVAGNNTSALISGENIELLGVDNSLIVQ